MKNENKIEKFIINEPEASIVHPHILSKSDLSKDECILLDLFRKGLISGKLRELSEELAEKQKQSI